MPDSFIQTPIGTADTSAPVAAPPQLSVDTTGASRWPALAAALLGALILLGVGFGSGIAHNAAHDTRHTLGFVCH